MGVKLNQVKTAKPTILLPLNPSYNERKKSNRTGRKISVYRSLGENNAEEDIFFSRRRTERPRLTGGD